MLLRCLAIFLLVRTAYTYANTAPTSPVNLTVSPSTTYTGQSVEVKWYAGTGHIQGASDFGVYLAAPGKGMQLVHGPVNWVSGSNAPYSTNIKLNNGVGAYTVRVYACNQSNYCSYSEKNVTVTTPPAPSAPVNMSLTPSSLTLGQSTQIKWSAGSGHIAGNSGFGVYLVAPGKAERLLHGPVNWSAGTSTYQTAFTPNEGAGTYKIKIYACNFDNYCSVTEQTLSVQLPSAPSAPQITLVPGQVSPGQSFNLKWTAGSGHVQSSSDFAVYRAPAGQVRQLIYGPVNWSAATSEYSAALTAPNTTGSYQYTVTACNYSNYCSNTSATVQVAPNAIGVPVISPQGGLFINEANVTLVPAASGVSTRYTTDGTDVSATSPLYTSPFTLSNSATVKAKSFKAGMTESPQAVASFAIQVANPLISPNGGTHNGVVPVCLSTTTSGAEIRYSTDGSDVAATSTLYSACFSLNSSATVKAKAFKTGMTASAQVTQNFVIRKSKVTVYRYDDLGRLKKTEDTVNGNRNYDYDAAGNRTQVSIGNN